MQGKELAVAIRKSPPTVSRIERGVRPVSLDVLGRIAGVYSIEPADLFRPPPTPRRTRRRASCATGN